MRRRGSVRPTDSAAGRESGKGRETTTSAGSATPQPQLYFHAERLPCRAAWHAAPSLSMEIAEAFNEFTEWLGLLVMLLDFHLRCV
jgi:hypothetical protein